MPVSNYNALFSETMTVSVVNIIFAKHQYVSIVNVRFTSQHRCMKMQPHRDANVATSFFCSVKTTRKVERWISIHLKKTNKKKARWTHSNYHLPSLLHVCTADDKASSETPGLWSRGGERHQRAQLLPLHGLGETGEQGGATTLQTESCKSVPAKPDMTADKHVQVTSRTIISAQNTLWPE